MAIRLVIPCSMRFCAAFNRPQRSLKSMHRALPMSVPPWRRKIISSRVQTVQERNSNSNKNSENTEINLYKKHYNLQYTNAAEYCRIDSILMQPQNGTFQGQLRLEN